MDFMDNVCASYALDHFAAEHVTTNGTKKILATLDRVKKERAKNKWVTFDRNGEYIVQVPYANTMVLVPVSFCDKDDIKHVLSYRWAGAHGQRLHENDAPIDFLCISATEKVWVDYLNHFNQDELKVGVIKNMGSLYNSLPVYAKYLHDFSLTLDRKGMSHLLACITRGWIWQEIAFTGPEITPEGAETIKLLVELIKTGSEIVRCLIDDGFACPNDRNVNEVIKFAVDALWRARNLADNESAYIFFIQDRDLNKSLIHEAIDKVIALRNISDQDPSKNVTMKVLAALDNLENANFSRVEDGFVASFSTLLQSYPDVFGPIQPGKIAPENLESKITEMLITSTRDFNWDLEWWQQCVIDHPLSQLKHPKFESITVKNNDIVVSVHDMDETFKLSLGYSRPLTHQELTKSTETVEGEHGILSLSYRIFKGELYVVGFQTKSLLRIVPKNALLVTDLTVMKVDDVKMSSRWMQTTWYSEDKKWLEVLAKWKEADEEVTSKKVKGIAFFGKNSKVAVS